MTLPGLIVRNALRNRRRVMLTVSSMALSLLLLTLLEVLLKGLTDPEGSVAGAERVAVRHSVSLANMLPAKYQARLERLPGVSRCTKLLWFGGIYQDPKNFFPQFACDADALFEVLTEARIDEAQRRQFLEERTACVAGARTAARFGWRLGERIRLLGAMWPANLELTLRGIYSGTFDDAMLFFHHEYLDEMLGDLGFTGLFWVRADSAARVPELIERIDIEFRNSDAETKTETEQAFALGFVSMLGNLKLLIRSISTVIVFTLVLVTAGTMSMAVRERTREVAILKALGFRTWRVFALILGESVGLALAGGLIGCLGAWGLLRAVDLYRLSGGLFVSFELTPGILAGGLLVAGLLGVGGCLIPAYGACRSGVVAGLTRPD
ncbi:MAG: FtsX-like permease family protein [Verrucomicrobia bacterium]|nr:FtsX-like permease family protein [Verrucomicrobiota bacterium]